MIGLNCCCRNCRDGGSVWRWLNVTTVKPEGACDPESTPTPVTPFPRHHTSDPDECDETAPCGHCGGWLRFADANGYPSQLIAGTDDIIACAEPGLENATDDHNCYLRSGTKDMTQARFGGRWVLAKKQWHGRFGVIDSDDPDIITGMTFDAGLADTHDGFVSTSSTFSTSAPQARYRTAVVTAEATTWTNYTHGTVLYSASLSGTASVNRLTGIETRSGSASSTYASWADPAATAFSLVASTSFNGWADYFFGFQTPGEITLGPNAYYTQSGSTYELHHGDDTGDGGLPDYLMERVVWNPGAGTFSRSKYRYMIDGSTARTITESVSIANTAVTYTSSITSLVAIDDGIRDFELTATLNLSDSYDNSMVCADLYAALADWPLDIPLFQTWRTDEKLALAPLCLYDEADAKVPTPSYAPLMDDYSAAQNEDLSWPQTAWLDPDGFVWDFGGNIIDHTAPVGFTGGASVITGRRTGAIISHTQSGSDRHFWFGYLDYRRVEVVGGGYAWEPNTFGAFTPTELPETAKRWMDRDEAQYDPAAIRGGLDDDLSGNYPQSFIKQRGAVAVAGKYVETTQRWPSVNYGQPCGASKYDVDQTTVCEILSVDGSTFTTRKTCNATTVPGVASKVLIEGHGICTVTGVTDGGTDTDGTNTWHVWIITVGSVIESVPAGRSCLVRGLDATDIYKPASYLGGLRWYDAGECSASDESSKRTGVRIVWTFNNRMTHVAAGSQPAWLGGSGAGTGTGIVGCTGHTITQFTYPAGCPAIVGLVPFYDGVPAETDGQSALAAMPSAINFDATYGALWLGAVEMTMPDPFWQEPFQPFDPELADDLIVGCNYSWIEDDGSRQTDVAGSVRYYPHHRMVEAATTIPVGKSLPAGLELFYGTGAVIAPPHYVIGTGGLPIANATGDYASFERPWGFTLRACSANGYSPFYISFTNCPP